MRNIVPISYAEAKEALEGKSRLDRSDDYSWRDGTSFSEVADRLFELDDGGGRLICDLERAKAKGRPVILDEGCGDLSALLDAYDEFGGRALGIGVGLEASLTFQKKELLEPLGAVPDAMKVKGKDIVAMREDAQQLGKLRLPPVDFCYSHHLYEWLALPYTALAFTANALSADGGVAYVLPFLLWPMHDDDWKPLPQGEMLARLNYSRSFEFSRLEVPGGGGGMRIERKGPEPFAPQLALGKRMYGEGAKDFIITEFAGGKWDGYLSFREYSGLLAQEPDARDLSFLGGRSTPGCGRY